MRTSTSPGPGAPTSISSRATAPCAPRTTPRSAMRDRGRESSAHRPAQASGRSRPSGSRAALPLRAGRRQRVRRRTAARAGTASAPSAIALTTSAAQRMPPSISTTASGSTSRTSTSASSAATAPSTCRPPWFETTMPSTPCCSASRASSAVSTPLTRIGREVCARSQSRSSHASPTFGNVASIVAAAVSGSSSGVLSSFEGTPDR